MVMKMNLNNKNQIKTNEIKQTFRTRLTGAPPTHAFKALNLEVPNLSVAEFKGAIQKEYKLNPILGIQLIFKGKVLPDNLKISKIGIHPTKDVITIMAIQGGG
ncbi:MAG: hypothetical protein GF311_13185 [Candidatus Lokiarchaeota archaeon]|nr:hypothetical protein [Candidatus Lokiarchaeota archaeon]